MRFLEILLPAHFLTLSCHFERAARIECNLITEIIGRESKNLPGTGDWLIGYSCAKHPNIPITQFSNSRINQLPNQRLTNTHSLDLARSVVPAPRLGNFIGFASSTQGFTLGWDIAHLRRLGFWQYHDGG